MVDGMLRVKITLKRNTEFRSGLKIWEEGASMGNLYRLSQNTPRKGEGHRKLGGSTSPVTDKLPEIPLLVVSFLDRKSKIIRKREILRGK